MRKTAKTLVMTGMMAFSLAALAPAHALAEEVVAVDAPEADLTLAAYSQYIWRGFAFSDSSVVIQPSMTVAYKGFAVNLWGNLDTDEVGLDEMNWNETDMTISYDGSVGKIGYGVGWINYDVDGVADTQEIYVSVSGDIMLAPTFTIYNDIDSVPGWYATLAVSHSVPVGEGLNLDLGAQIGYLDDDANYNEFHDALVSASMTFAVNDYISVTPELNYSFALTSDAETMIAGGSADADDNHLFGGVSASLAF